MSDPKDTPIEERVSYLEKELTSSRKQIEKLYEELLGTITILCLPLNKTRRLELGLKQVEKLPNNPLKMIIQRYVIESKKIDLSFDEIINPIVSVLGFDRAWKLLPSETIREIYGEWASAKWEEMGRNHTCEEEK